MVAWIVNILKINKPYTFYGWVVCDLYLNWVVLFPKYQDDSLCTDTFSSEKCKLLKAQMMSKEGVNRMYVLIVCTCINSKEYTNKANENGHLWACIPLLFWGVGGEYQGLNSEPLNHWATTISPSILYFI